jgi:hypothetical protein
VTAACSLAYNIVRCSVQYGQMFENSKNKEFLKLFKNHSTFKLY